MWTSVKKIAATGLLLAGLTPAGMAAAGELVTLTITVTNNTVTWDQITVNSDTRYWTNLSSSTFISTNSQATPGGAATNMYRAFAAYRFTGPLVVQQPSSNVVTLQGQVAQAISASTAGTWATLSLATQTVSAATAMVYPFTSIAYATNRTNQANGIVDGLNDFGQNTFDTNSPVLVNFLNIGPANQTIEGPRIWQGTNYFYNAEITNGFLRRMGGISGNIVGFTNGYLTNAVLDRAVATNLLIPGPYGVTSYSLGLGNAAAEHAFAFGVLSIASNSSIAIGVSSLAIADDTVAIGNGATAGLYPGDGSTSIGGFSDADAHRGTALGYLASAGHAWGTALGAGVATTASNQVKIGKSDANVLVDGVFMAAVTTNSTLAGSNNVTGDLAYKVVTINTLANGANQAVGHSNATYLRFTGTLTADSTLDGITGGRDGRILYLENQTGYQLTIVDESGLETTAANRFDTYGDKDQVLQDEAWCRLHYNATESRWHVAEVHPDTLATTNAIQLLDGVGTNLTVYADRLTNSSLTVIAESGMNTNIVEIQDSSGGIVFNVQSNGWMGAVRPHAVIKRRQWSGNNGGASVTYWTNRPLNYIEYDPEDLVDLNADMTFLVLKHTGIYRVDGEITCAQAAAPAASAWGESNAVLHVMGHTAVAGTLGDDVKMSVSGIFTNDTANKMFSMYWRATGAFAGMEGTDAGISGVSNIFTTVVLERLHDL